MTVAIFGGSFSPVHAGHLAVAKGIIDKKLADEVWMLPCKRNPLKEKSPQFDDDARVEMIKEALATMEGRSEIPKGSIKVDKIEFSLPSPSYTCDTLRELQKRHPGVKFRLAAGSDSYMNFQQWKNWEWIEQNFSPIVYPRPGYEILEIRPLWTLMTDVPKIDISSTELREKLGIKN